MGTGTWKAAAVGLFLIITSCAAPPAAKPNTSLAPCVRYISELQQAVGRSRSQLPVMTRTAEAAAKRFIDGGNIYAGGSQQDFANELFGRSGGLMSLKKLTDDVSGRPNDVVLYAARSTLTYDDRVRVSRLRQAGAEVIVFASAALSSHSTIDSGPTSGVTLSISKIAPTDSVINIMNGWAWTGEFIAACTRLGKMPTVYQSYAVAGGPERGAKYEGKTFHDDFEIAPIKPGALGGAYLQHIARGLSSIRNDSAADLARAGVKLREATPARSVFQISGHTFPHHYKDVRAPQPFGTAGHFTPDAPPAPGAMTLVLAFIKPPQLAVNAANVSREMLLYSSVERARDDGAPFILYIDPHFPNGDACVEIKGYDIAALPASAVMQAAIYWALVSEAYPPAGAAR